MPGGVLRRLGIVEVRDLIVPVAGVRPTQVRTRLEALVDVRTSISAWKA